MPTSFLDLPRELRDAIYDLVLVSPTGHIEPIPGRTSRTAGRFSVYIAPYDPQSKTWTTDRHQTSPLSDNVLSLSLLRTCRQIRSEPGSIFWAKNTFLFKDPKTMARTLNAMGQIASRRIQFIRCTSLGLIDEHPAVLPEGMKLLVSRARLGAFQHLFLDLYSNELDELSFRKSTGYLMEQYKRWLEALRKVSPGRLYQRTIQVHSVHGITTGVDLLRDLHLAVGGTMICDGDLVWELQTNW